MTFEEAFDRRMTNGRRSFHDWVWHQGIPPHSRWIARLLHLVHPRFFDADERLILAIAESQTVDEVRKEAREFLQLRANQTWLRRVVKVRLSATRVIQLSKEFLPEKLGSRRPWSETNDGQ